MALPPERVTVLLNGNSGAVAELDPAVAEARLSEAFAAAGASISLRRCAGEAIAEAAREAAARGAGVVAVGGGDGTLSTAASALAGGRVPLGVLPLGTLNHFARDLGIPLELAEAAKTIVAGHARAVDLGELNGRVFLNNSSIGLYPNAVEGREALRDRRGLGKWPAMVYAAGRVLRRYPLLTVTMEAAGVRQSLRTPFVFVGNNAYELKLLELGRRAALDRGELSLYVARHETRSGLLRLVLRALAGRLHQDRDFRALSVPELTIESRRPWLPVAADGEVRQVRPPIRYRILPRALWVVVPEA